MKQKGYVINLNKSKFIPDPEKVLVTSVCRDAYADSEYHILPSSITANGFQDGFGEYSTHLPSEYKFYTNQPSYGISFLEANVKGPTYLQYPETKTIENKLIFDWNWSRWTGNHLVWNHPRISPDEAEELLGEMRTEVNSPLYNPNVQSLWETRTGNSIIN